MRHKQLFQFVFAVHVPESQQHAPPQYLHLSSIWVVAARSPALSGGESGIEEEAVVQGLAPTYAKMF